MAVQGILPHASPYEGVQVGRFSTTSSTQSTHQPAVKIKQEVQPVMPTQGCQPIHEMNNISEARNTNPDAETYDIKCAYSVSTPLYWLAYTTMQMLEQDLFFLINTGALVNLIN